MMISMILKRFVCMAQDSSKIPNIGIIGGGASGCACAYFIKQFSPQTQVSIIDYGNFLRTLLPTGGGRCNLAHYEFDFKELAKNYPRGEKFLYSVFSRFSTADTIEFFENIGVSTYVQEDMRVFPESNSAKAVQTKLLEHLKNVKFIKVSVQTSISTADLFTQCLEYLKKCLHQCLQQPVFQDGVPTVLKSL